MTRAVLLRLDGGAHLGGDLGEMSGDLLPGVPDDHDEMLRLQLIGGGEHMAHQGTAADLVQDLGCGRLHTGALTRCEYDDGCRANGAHRMPFGCGRGVDNRRIPGWVWGQMRAGPDRVVRARIGCRAPGGGLEPP
ncbi:hypothetical protein GCM10010254_53470 [Streptomyces chromofuscus]|nr:hypothetical protein GCM10010254_53470 [Streptomyces chromofuscus]